MRDMTHRNLLGVLALVNLLGGGILVATGSVLGMVGFCTGQILLAILICTRESKR